MMSEAAALPNDPEPESQNEVQPAALGGRGNPVLLRELQQSSRLLRTPYLLAVTAALAALLICSIGGLASVSAEPATVGLALFHTYFSLCYAIVTWAGPAVAANAIASERSGFTWEALILTGLPPERIARGKFGATMVYTGAYLVALAPVGAIPFLFGGVTALEVVLAFVALAAIAVLSTSVGLAISSKFQSPASAIIITLLVMLPVSILGYIFLGPVLSIAVHDYWPSVPRGPPIWWPTAVARAPFGVDYVALLLIVPAAAFALPTWLMYEVTVANMKSPADDRSTGVRRWWLVAGPVFALALASCMVVVLEIEWMTTIVSVYFAFLLFCTFLFAGEPLWASRRVRLLWEKQNASVWRRWMGPGIMSASNALMLVGLLGLVVIGGVGMARLEGHRGAPSPEALGVVVGYALAFFAFCVGLMAWVRTRSRSAAVTRIIVVAAIFVVAAGPWIAMAIFGVLTDATGAAQLIAAPSFIYALEMQDAVRGSLDADRLLAGLAAAAGWGFLAIGLLAAASARVRRLYAESISGANVAVAAPGSADAPASAIPGEGGAAVPAGEAVTSSVPTSTGHTSEQPSGSGEAAESSGLGAKPEPDPGISGRT